MTVRALLGLAAFDGLLVVVGAIVLWAAGALRTMADAVRLAGVALLLGVSVVTIGLIWLLTVGVPLVWAFSAVVALACVGGLVVGLACGRPGLSGRVTRLPVVPLAIAPLVGVIGLYALGATRAARLQGLSEFDAWWCWALHAKAIYYFDGLDPELVGQAERCPGYPPGLAGVEASAFHAMGSVDVVTFHLQAVVLLLALVAGVAGLFHRRVRGELVAPFALFALVLPSVTDRIADGRADLPLGVLVVLGAVLVVRWLETPEPWLLPLATLALAAAVLTKREGILFALVVMLAAAVATAPAARSCWPRLAGAAIAVVLAGLPWRLWLAANGARSGSPETGYLGLFDEPGRALPSLELAVRTFFDPDLWLVATPVAVAAGALAVVAGVRRVGGFVLAFALLSVVACWWVVWTNPSLELTQDYGLNPIVRLVGTPVLGLVLLTPLALQRAWEPGTIAIERRRPTRRATLTAWIVVLAVVALYPLSAAAGISSFRLPGGWPAFPGAAAGGSPVATSSQPHTLQP